MLAPFDLMYSCTTVQASLSTPISYNSQGAVNESNIKQIVITFTTTQLHFTTFLGFPSLSILQSPTHSPSSSLSSTYSIRCAKGGKKEHNSFSIRAVSPPPRNKQGSQVVRGMYHQSYQPRKMVWKPSHHSPRKEY